MGFGVWFGFDWLVGFWLALSYIAFVFLQNCHLYAVYTITVFLYVRLAFLSLTSGETKTRQDNGAAMSCSVEKWNRPMCPSSSFLLSSSLPRCGALRPTRLKGGSFRAWELSDAISESRFSLEPYAFRRCGDFHGGWLCTLVFYILLCQNAWLCTSAAAIWHHLAGELRSYCSVQGGPLLWSRGDGRGGRARPALVALLPLDSVTAALGRCHCCSQTLVVQSV